MAIGESGQDRLILYMRDWCGYCSMVRHAARNLGLALEERNIWDNTQWQNDLIQARGRATVPVLLRQSANGKSEWMGESRDIIQYLAHYRETLES
ncbi:MAG: glutaredoxin [Acidiferrobacteraceae bacterium]|nr:glutaredoxin [Acidiferrobacteraceae bacterium]